jgi:hypothetical protein
VSFAFRREARALRRQAPARCLRHRTRRQLYTKCRCAHRRHQRCHCGERRLRNVAVFWTASSPPLPARIWIRGVPGVKHNGEPRIIKCGAFCEVPGPQKRGRYVAFPRGAKQIKTISPVRGRNAGMSRLGRGAIREAPASYEHLPSRPAAMRCSAPNFAAAIALYVSTPQMPGYGQAPACPRAVEKTATFRSLRSPQWQRWCRRQAQ